VSTIAPADGAAAPLDALLRQAGAVFAGHNGARVAIHYGSAAGELAVCVSAVGLVDRSGLSKLMIEAPPSSLTQLTSRMIGGQLTPGGSTYADGAWWCGAANDRILVLTDRSAAQRLVERLRIHAVHNVVRRLRDCSGELAAIGVLGPATPHVLRALGAYGAAGDPRLVAPFQASSAAGAAVWWLLESDHSATALVSPDCAAQVWRAIETAGRPFGISCVGQEAAGRYALLERARNRPSALVG
jgi:glycine cleavage system aminomethyltransferase T